MSDSISVPGSAEQLTATKGSERRALASWSARATSSLPVPVSPRMRTVAFASATRRIRCRTFSMAREDPAIAPTPRVLSTFCRSAATSPRSACRSRKLWMIGKIISERSSSFRT